MFNNDYQELESSISSTSGGLTFASYDVSITCDLELGEQFLAEPFSYNKTYSFTTATGTSISGSGTSSSLTTTGYVPVRYVGYGNISGSVTSYTVYTRVAESSSLSADSTCTLTVSPTYTASGSATDLMSSTISKYPTLTGTGVASFSSYSITTGSSTTAVAYSLSVTCKISFTIYALITPVI